MAKKGRKKDRTPGDDEPVGRMLRVVTVCDCTPAYADAPEVGEPIAIITMEHKGELDQPMLITMRDVRLLLNRLKAVVEFHEGTGKTDPDSDPDG